jgi:hypothetical protein
MHAWDSYVWTARYMHACSHARPRTFALFKVLAVRFPVQKIKYDLFFSSKKTQLFFYKVGFHPRSPHQALVDVATASTTMDLHLHAHRGPNPCCLGVTAWCSSPSPLFFYPSRGWSCHPPRPMPPGMAVACHVPPVFINKNETAFRWAINPRCPLKKNVDVVCFLCLLETGYSNH